MAPIPPEERASGADDAAATTQLPTVGEEPASRAESSPSAAQPSSAEQREPTSTDAPTQSFPRPPDDEDFGHHPDHHDLG